MEVHLRLFDNFALLSYANAYTNGLMQHGFYIYNLSCYISFCRLDQWIF